MIAALLQAPVSVLRAVSHAPTDARPAKPVKAPQVTRS